MSIYDSLLTPDKPSTAQPSAPSYGIYDSLVASQPSPQIQKAQTEANQATQEANFASSPIGLASNTISNVVDTLNPWKGIQQAIPQVGQDIQQGYQTAQTGFNNQESTALVKGVATGGFRATADILNGIFYPISATIGSALKATGAQSLMDSAGQVIADKSGITDWPAFQKFAEQHPNAGEDFNRLMTLALTFMGGGEVKEAPKTSIEDAKAFAEKIIPPDAPPPSAESPIVPVKSELPPSQGDQIVQKGSESRITAPPETAPISPLAQEAQKYKSAEEFVKAQPKVYHGGTADIKAVDLGKTNFQKTFYVSDKADYAKSFGGNKSAINEMVLDPKAKLADMRKPSEELVSQIDQMTQGRTTGKTINITKPDGTILGIPEVVDRPDFGSFSQKQVIQGIRDGKAHFAELPEIKKALQKLGYDGQITAEVPNAKNIGVWNKEVIKTKSQLTDFYNKVKGQTTEPSTGTTPSGIAQSIEAKAVEANLTKKFENVAEYTPSTIKEQARIFSDTLTTHGEEGLRSIIRGETPLPEGAKGFPFIVSAEAYLKEHPNPEMAYELANSPHVSAASEAASQLGLGQNREQDSFTAKVQEIRKAREDELAKRGGDTVKQDVVAKIKDAVRKTNTKENWGDFVKSLEC